MSRYANIFFSRPDISDNEFHFLRCTTSSGRHDTVVRGYCIAFVLPEKNKVHYR